MAGYVSTHHFVKILPVALGREEARKLERIGKAESAHPLLPLAVGVPADLGGTGAVWAFKDAATGLRGKAGDEDA